MPKRNAASKMKPASTTPAEAEPLIPMIVEPNEKAVQRGFVGSKFDHFNRMVLGQAANAQWFGDNPSDNEQRRLRMAAAGGMADIAPQSGVEGMLAAQMVATHAAAMECFKRAMVSGQPVQSRDYNLNQANKLVRSMATLVQTLDKHRGKGQQTVRVEHVHVYEGGQAIVGPVAQAGAAIPAPVTRAIAEASGLAAITPEETQEAAPAAARDGEG